MKKIAVIGTGYVGLVSGTCFAEIGNKIICCDIDEQKIAGLKSGIVPIYEPGLEEMVQYNVKRERLSFTTDIPQAIRESDIIYIAVGTPMSENGEADLSYIRAAAKTIGENMNAYKIVVNKSTVPVGTGQLVKAIIQDHLKNKNIEFDVVSNPEFLREGNAISDSMNMERAIIGATSNRAAEVIKELHEPFKTSVFVTDLESAEMIKYAANAFLATKISFINDIANICERVGADVTKVAEGIGMDSRIGKRFLNAGIGYGGSCFPKDTVALVHIAEQSGYDFELLKSVIETNDKQKINFLDKIISVLGKDLQGKTLAVLGLAFKPNTNDMRYAPSLTVIPELLDRGASVKAYDAIAIEEAKKFFGDRISYHRDVYETLMDCDAAIILTEWKEVAQLELPMVSQLLKNPIIFDGRNCYTLKEMQEAGFEYYSIGRRNVFNESLSNLAVL